MTSDYEFSTYVPLDLRQGIPTYVDVNDLPLSAKQCEIVLMVQGVNRSKERYMLKRKGQSKITMIKDSETGFDGYWLDWLTARVYKDRAMTDEYEFHIDGKGHYLVGKHIGLHRLVALQWLRLTDKKMFEAAKKDGRAFPCHHREPWLKQTPEGNNIWNVEILPIDLHKRYESIVDELIAKYKRGDFEVVDNLSKTHVLQYLMDSE